jgi:hypothetical protein
VDREEWSAFGSLLLQNIHHPLFLYDRRGRSIGALKTVDSGCSQKWQVFLSSFLFTSTVFVHQGPELTISDLK